MYHQVPPKSRAKYSRREFIRRSAGATAFLGLAALTSKQFPGSAVAEESYAGDLVLVSQLGANPDKALPRILEAFKAANPGINTKTVLYPEEKFVALYTAAQAAGEQIDVLMLNGQDLRRYATSGALVTYLDWFWPPEITRAFQEGLQAGLAGRVKAEEMAKNVQTIFDRLVSNGYSFKA